MSAVPPPARALDEARRAMRWRIEPAAFALVGFPEPPAAEDLALLAGDGPAQVVREGGETTVLGPEDLIAGVLARHPGARVERELLWVRFELPMTWELVGFLALVTGRLAEAGVPLGAVCGFSRDHLFVARPYEEALRGALRELFPGGEPPAPG